MSHAASSSQIWHGTTILTVRKHGKVVIAGDGQVSLGDTPAGTVEYQTIFAVGAMLFLITLGLNMGAHKIVRRFREAYE